jgi:hypothetical protein
MGMVGTIHAMIPGTMPAGDIVDTVDLGKCWHAIHYLLSGTGVAGDDASQFLLSGKPMQDVSDCEVFQNSSDKVQRFAAFLESASNDALYSRCDSRRAGEIDVYNYEFLEPDGRRHIEQYLNDLRDFVSRHSKAGHDLLVVIA